MINAILFRIIIVILQLSFVLTVAAKFSASELGLYYKNLSIAFLLSSLLFAYPEYIFQKLIAECKINRKSINYYLLPLLVLLSVPISISIYFQINIIASFILLFLLTTTNLLRIYINALSFRNFTMTTQIIEGIFKLILLLAATYTFERLMAIEVLFIQAISSLMTIYYIYQSTLKKNTGKHLLLQQTTNSHSVRDIVTITVNTFINAAYVNFLKIYLGLVGSIEEVGMLGLAQQLGGNLVQSINSILQVQYGNQVLRNIEFFNRAFIPVIIFAILGGGAIIIAKIYILDAFVNRYSAITSTYFLLVFSYEYYIVPLSFLTKFYIRKNMIDNIFYLHLLLLFSIILSIIQLILNGELIYSLAIGSASTLILVFIYYRKVNNV